MERALRETDRRRQRQESFNHVNGIVPRGVVKDVKDLIDGVYDPQQAKQELKAAEIAARFDSMSEKSVARELKRLEKLMLEHARNLEFEKAAQARDQLSQLKEQLFGASGSSKVVPLAGTRAA
jgi:excinuclease ABC subunit B